MMLNIKIEDVYVSIVEVFTDNVIHLNDVAKLFQYIRGNINSLQ